MRFFHPEIQAEIEFGLEQSRDSTSEDMLDNLSHFYARDASWEEADQAILSLREGISRGHRQPQTIWRRRWRQSSRTNTPYGIPILQLRWSNAGWF